MMLPVNFENWYPGFAVAITVRIVPLLNHPLAGEMTPPFDGLAEVVRKYCVVKLAVYVAATEGATTVWEAAPPSDQL